MKIPKIADTTLPNADYLDEIAEVKEEDIDRIVDEWSDESDPDVAKLLQAESVDGIEGSTV